MKSWARKPVVWIGFALSGLAIITLALLFDPRQVYASLLQVQMWVLPLAAAFILTAFLLRALRWKLLLRPVADLPLHQVRDVLMTGFMVNNVLPARMGELARALVLWRVAGTSRRATLAAIGVERLFDVATLISILSVLGLAFAVPPWTRNLGRVTGVLLVGMTVGVIWLAYHHRSLFWLLDKFLFFLPRARREASLGFMERFVDGTRSLRSPSLTLSVASLSLIIWGLEFLMYWLMLRGFSISLPAWSAALVLVVANFGIAVPSAPGYVGVFDAACSGALITLGLNRDLALSYAIGVHILLYVCVTGTGLILMWRLGIKLADLNPQDGD